MVKIKTEIILNKSSTGGYWAGINIAHSPIKPVFANNLDWATGLEEFVNGQVYVFTDRFMNKLVFLNYIKQQIAQNICFLTGIPVIDVGLVKDMLEQDFKIIENNSVSLNEPKKDEWIVW